MFLNVVTLSSLVTMCVGGPPLQPLYPSGQVSSSQSFTHENVPLFYKINTFHIQTTTKRLIDKQEQEDISNYQAVQYAPLGQKPDESYVVPYTKTSASTPNVYNNDNRFTIRPAIKKEHLEPHIRFINNTDAHHPHLYTPYVPGHNIQVYQALNRNPGYNALYRSYPETVSREYQNKIDYHRQNVIYKKPEQQKDVATEDPVPTTVTQATLTSENVVPQHLEAIHKEHAEDAILTAIGAKDWATASFAKMPRIHLNLARTIGFRSAHKTSIYKTPLASKESKIKPKTLLEQITYLYPVQNKKRYFSEY